MSSGVVATEYELDSDQQVFNIPLKGHFASIVSDAGELKPFVPPSIRRIIDRSFINCIN